MSAFQRAIASNNHGVKLLESNDTLLAMAVFQGGIQMIKECGYNHIKNHTLASDEQNDHSPSLATNPTCCQICAPLKSEDFSQRLYYSYDRPILLPTILMASTSQVIQSKLHLISSILLFNLALSYQKYSNENCTSSNVIGVVRVFTLAATILEQRCCDDDWGKFMLCLIFNNLANLYYELCDYHASHRLFSQIKPMVSNDVALNVFALNFLSEDEWIEVQLNCIYSQIPSAAATA